MESIRKPTLKEVRLIAFLIKVSGIAIPTDWNDGLLVKPMDDGGMGSLFLYPKGIITENRSLSKQVADFQFKDQDGVEVIASLNLDSCGDLFELDIWKTDFSRLLVFPEI